MRDKRDRQKKRFVAALTEQGTVYHAAQAAGISRWAAYRWRDEDPEFANLWDEAIENAVDAARLNNRSTHKSVDTPPGLSISFSVDAAALVSVPLASQDVGFE